MCLHNPNDVAGVIVAFCALHGQNLIGFAGGTRNTVTQQKDKTMYLCIYVSYFVSMYPCIYISTNPSNHPSILPSIPPYYDSHITSSTTLSPNFLPHFLQPRCTALLAGEEAKVVLFVDPDVGPRAVLWADGGTKGWMGHKSGLQWLLRLGHNKSFPNERLGKCTKGNGGQILLGRPQIDQGSVHWGCEKRPM